MQNKKANTTPTINLDCYVAINQFRKLQEKYRNVLEDLVALRKQNLYVPPNGKVIMMVR